MVGRVSKRGRPVPGDVRAHILAVAQRLFAAHGFDGTSLQAIADEVGVAKPSVLHYFPSKEALRESVLDTMLAHFSEALPRLLLAATAGEGRFDGLTSEMVSFFASDPDRAKLLLRETLDRPAAVRALLVAHVKPWLDAVAAYIRKGQRHGEHFADVDPEAYVLHVIHLLVGGLAVADTFRVLLPHADGAVNAAHAKTADGAARADGDGDATTRRYLGELTRIAKSSLFVPSPADVDHVRAAPSAPSAPSSNATTTTSTTTSTTPDDGSTR
ncbi:TetR/AcrR family transcriptional regulator [bacterium]|nr:MAG: TetR/AcrR family transcriptional regulator [bacterium]